MYDNAMNLKNKFYQMFMLAPQGDNFSDEVNLKLALKNGLGGVIFFTKNIISIEQTKTLVDRIKNTALITPFIGIDQEGGRVERTENIFNGKKFLSAKYQAQNGIEFTEQETTKIAKLIKSMGFNMNFAPVLDVNTNPQNPIIGERAYGTNAKEVEKYAILAMKTYLKNYIIPVGKHFPGHGDVNMDSHLTLPTLELALEETIKEHIQPFKTAIENNIPAIMVAHLYCPCFDKKKKPSSLSFNVINYLRKNLKFKGIVISDDMQMGALQNTNSTDAILQGINAGINLFLYRDSVSQTIDLIENTYKIIEKDKTLTSKIEKAFDIIQLTKSSYSSFF